MTKYSGVMMTLPMDLKKSITQAPSVVGWRGVSRVVRGGTGS